MKPEITDKELEKLLAAVKAVKLPEGFSDRLQSKLLLENEERSNVIAFPQNKPVQQQPQRRMWWSAIPLAASLALGVYIGAMGSLPESLSGLEGTLISDGDDTIFGTGFEDTLSFVDGELS
jgi:hypothetical protein